jgi:membrane glycosyltransferase
MAYGSALLWFLFLALATAAAITEAIVQPDYFAPAKSLFPIWPVWDPTPALFLLAGTAVILFLPKVCALLLALIKGRRKQFGGFFALCGSIMTEVVLSTLLAPVRMLFHSKYVFLTLMGMGIGWGTQQRDDEGTRFWDALRFHGGGTLLGLVWGVAMFQINRVFFWWSSPLVLSLLLSIPVSMLTSRAELGRLFRGMRIFTTPEEIRRPREYEDIDSYLQKIAEDRSSFGIPPEEGFLRAAVIPGVNTLHRTMLRGPRTLAPEIEQRRDAILEKTMGNGPESLSKKEKKELLYDAQRMKRLHEHIWELPQDELEMRWKVRLD